MFTTLDTTTSSQMIVVVIDSDEPVDLDDEATHTEVVAFARESASIGEGWYLAEGPHRPASSYDDIEMVFLRG